MRLMDMDKLQFMDSQKSLMRLWITTFEQAVLMKKC